MHTVVQLLLTHRANIEAMTKVQYMCIYDDMMIVMYGLRESDGMMCDGIVSVCLAVRARVMYAVLCVLCDGVVRREENTSLLISLLYANIE